MRFGILQWLCSQSANHPSSSEGKGYFIYKTRSQKSLSKIAITGSKIRRRKVQKHAVTAIKGSSIQKGFGLVSVDGQRAFNRSAKWRVEEKEKRLKKEEENARKIAERLQIQCAFMKNPKHATSEKYRLAYPAWKSRERRNIWKCTVRAMLILYTVLKKATKYEISSALGRKCAHICIAESHN